MSGVMAQCTESQGWPSRRLRTSARGADHPLSDLDVIVVSDDAMAAVVGGPFLGCAGGPLP